MTAGIDKIVFLPDGREALIVMQIPPTRLSSRMMRALGALHWGFPNKAMCDASRMRLPDWPEGVSMWVITHRSLCALRMPCHDPSPVRLLASNLHGGHIDVGSAAMNEWECYK